MKGMENKKRSVAGIALIVALGGLLMGFDASVISGVVGFIETEFELSKIELGWSVSSLTLTATLAMLIAGPLSDRIGRKNVLTYAAILYAISAIASALAPDFITLVVARMIGGLGVGASLIIAPMYIAEISPAHMRGRMVSFNQLNIVIGISLAFFTNYLILQWGKSDAALAESLKFAEYNWRWMLGLETLPAILYFFGLFVVPKSPRWLLMRNKKAEAIKILEQFNTKEQVRKDVEAISLSIKADEEKEKVQIGELFKPALTLVLTIGIVIAILQQITGINSVFFYAPMIFEQSGIGTDASFVQAILVGLTNLVFTILAIAFIDKLGRKPLLIIGVTGIALCMFLLAYSFNSATYKLGSDITSELSESIDREKLSAILDIEYSNDVDFKKAINDALGEPAAKEHGSQLITAAINMNPTLILFGIIGFVASFAISLGPVMWVLFSELFPNRIRGLAISFVGLINSAISFTVQLVFPWELENLGNATTFLIYGVFALLGLLFIIRKVPENKGK
jgi:sugar porter (SP) family MFS transporter